jgi:hypothetical protein
VLVHLLGSEKNSAVLSIVLLLSFSFFPKASAQNRQKCAKANLGTDLTKKSTCRIPRLQDTKPRHATCRIPRLQDTKPRHATEAITEEQLEALQARLQALHEAELLSEAELASLEDTIAD